MIFAIEKKMLPQIDGRRNRNKFQNNSMLDYRSKHFQTQIKKCQPDDRLQFVPISNSALNNYERVPTQDTPERFHQLQDYDHSLPSSSMNIKDGQFKSRFGHQLTMDLMDQYTTQNMHSSKMTQNPY